MTTPEFRAGAEAAYKVLVDSRRIQKAVITADDENASQEPD